MTEWDDTEALSEILTERLPALFGLSPRVRVLPLGVSENSTFLIEDPERDHQTVLRIHRHGYHDRQAIESELKWLQAIREQTSLLVPEPVPDLKGDLVTTLVLPSGQDRNAVMFSKAPGRNLTLEDLTSDWYERLGALAAELHQHSVSWEPPESFRRFSWFLPEIVGPKPRFGNWRDHPDLTHHQRTPLEAAEQELVQRLEDYDAAGGMRGLIHGDLHLLNVMRDKEDLWSIDYDDCGFSWLMFDVGAAFQFVPHGPKATELLNAWADGYQRVRPLIRRDRESLEDFVMLRRLMLLGWSATHPKAQTPRTIGAICNSTAAAADQYLASRAANLVTPQ